MRNRMLLFLIPILLALASLMPGCLSATDQTAIERLDDGLGAIRENSEPRPGVNRADYENAWDGATGTTSGLRQRYAHPPTPTATR